jgi:hypothetical protein
MKNRHKLTRFIAAKIRKLSARKTWDACISHQQCLQEVNYLSTIVRYTCTQPPELSEITKIFKIQDLR